MPDCPAYNPAYTPLSLPAYLTKMEQACLQDMGCWKCDRVGFQRSTQHITPLHHPFESQIPAWGGV